MHLGRAGQRAGREGGAQHVHAGHAVIENAFNIAHDVHDVAVALHGESLGDLYRAGFGDAADVVARQVNQHDMLGALFRVVDEFLLCGLVRLWRRGARPGPRERPDSDHLPLPGLLLPHQNFGRCADHMKVAKVIVVHVGRGIERAQGAVQAQGRFGVALLDALAHLHLHEVTRFDQLFGAHDRGQVISLGKVALGGVALRGQDPRRADRVFELVLELAQALFGVGVGLGQRRVGIDDEIQLARQVVDHGQLFALQQQDVGATERVGRARAFEFFLDVAHRVIAKVAGQPAAKARQTRPQRHLEALLVVADEVERVHLRCFNHPAIGDHLGQHVRPKARGAHQRAGGQTDKAVAAKALATDHRFQQEAELAAVFGKGQFEIERERGLQVGERLDHQRNAVEALGRQAFEFEFSNHNGSFANGQRT